MSAQGGDRLKDNLHKLYASYKCERAVSDELETLNFKRFLALRQTRWRQATFQSLLSIAVHTVTYPLNKMSHIRTCLF